jgi:hypothetical protein
VSLTANDPIPKSHPQFGHIHTYIIWKVQSVGLPGIKQTDVAFSLIYSARCTWIILFPAEGGIRSLAKLSREEMVAVKHYSLNCLFDYRVGLGWEGW